MSKRRETITEESLDGIYRHHPYLALFQKEDWRGYLQLLAEIYDVLEEQGSRISIDIVRAIAARFYAGRELASVEQKVLSFFTMAIGELQVLKDSHDQFGQRYIETTRSGKSLLQFTDSLIAQRSKFSGIGAETLLGALNDILLSRQQITLEEAIQHHKEKIESYREDLARIKQEGLAAARLLPMEHSTEALFSQAEDAAVQILQSVEEVKSAIELQRKELAEGYFQNRQSPGQTLGAVADFYEGLYKSTQYTSYVQAKEMLSHLEGFQNRFTMRNVDRLLHSIENRELVLHDAIKRSNLRGFMHQFSVADSSIQDKIQAQIRILQQQVLYSVTTDVKGLQSSLFDLLANLSVSPGKVLNFLEEFPILLEVRDEIEAGPVEVFDFELPVEVTSQVLSEESFDLRQEQELFLALIQAEEGTLKDILERLSQHLAKHGELRARDHQFLRGLAEYYVLSEIDLFSDEIEKVDDGELDLVFELKKGAVVLRNATVFVLKRKEVSDHG